METKQLVLKYWNSWQGDPDWESFRECLDENCKVNMGVFEANNAEMLLTITKSGNPWKDVEMLELICDENKAALIYQGTDTTSGQKFRVSEFITLDNHKIQQVIGSIAMLTT